jgi:hypothetical protein
MTEEKKNDAAQILHEDNNKLPTGEMLLPSLLEEDEKSGAISVEEWLAITSGGTCKALELSPDAERWHEIRKEEALAIDPETAEVCWDYGEYSDPYKLYPVVPEFPVDPLEKMYFVRRPDGDIWVRDNDLPDAVFAALWERLEAIEDDIPCFMSVRASTNPIRFFRRCSTTLQIPLRCERPLDEDRNDHQTRGAAEGINAGLAMVEDENLRPGAEEDLAIIREEASRIDPDAADVCWAWSEWSDPYGFCDIPDPQRDHPEKFWFVRRSGSGVWVHERDLPGPVFNAICEHIRSRGIKVLWMGLCDD